MPLILFLSCTKKHLVALFVVFRYSVLMTNCTALQSIKVLFIFLLNCVYDQVERCYLAWTVQSWENVPHFRAVCLNSWSLISLTVEERAASKRTEISSKTSSSGRTTSQISSINFPTWQSFGLWLKIYNSLLIFNYPKAPTIPFKLSFYSY